MKSILICTAALLCLLCISCGGGEGRPDGGDGGADAGPIEILTDNMGIPHIFAATDEEAFFAAGYVTAGDRMYQMEMLRRFALGRLSEVLGEEGLLRDMQARTFDFPRWGREDLAATKAADPERARLISAWVSGINRRVEEYRSGKTTLPFGYRKGEKDFLPEPWSEEDPYIVLKGAGFANDKTVEFEVALTLLYALYANAMGHVQIFKPAHPFFGVPPEDRPKTINAVRRSGAPFTSSKPTPLSDAELRGIFLGLKRFFESLPPRPSSNSWAIDGRFTDTGRTLIAGDPHLSFGFFGSPYPMHINSKARGGTYDVAGFAYPGTPAIALGFNDRMVWTVTTNMGDVNDIWKVVKESGRVMVGGAWQKISRRTEQIAVREPGKPAGEGRVVTMKYDDVPGYGVILPSEIIGIPGAELILGDVLMNWTGFTGRPARWFMELNRISSLDDFEAAADRMREMSYNLIAADAGGIAYRVGLDLPARPDVSGARAPWRAMDGNDPGSLWTGAMLERRQVPRGRGATRGWLATANTDPWGFTADGLIDNDPWYYGSFFDAGYRGQRIEDEILRLTGAGKVTLEDMKALQMDARSRMSDDLLPLLAAAQAKIPTDAGLARFRNNPDLDRVLKLLTAEWDRRMARDSAGALAWQVFMHSMTRAVLKDNIPQAYDVAVELMTVFVVKVAAMTLLGEYPDGEAILKDGKEAILLQAAADTASWLKGRFGTVEPSAYSYKDVKETSFDEAFGMGMPVFQKPGDGGEDTLCVSTNITPDQNALKWTSNYVSVERTVGTFSADGTPEVHVNFPVGNTADPGSEDTARANDDYLNGRYRKFLFGRQEIEASLRQKTVLYMSR